MASRCIDTRFRRDGETFVKANAHCAVELPDGKYRTISPNTDVEKLG